MAEWVSVKDMLPVDVGQVLLCFGEPFFGSPSPEIETGYFDEESGKFLFWMGDREVKGYGVTHWMSLPGKPWSTVCEFNAL